MHNYKQKYMNLVIASKNKGKINEYIELLSKFPIEINIQSNDLVIEEIGKTFKENARIKAVNVALLTGQYALADDSGLCVDALNGNPGIYSSRYEKTDEKRIDKLLNELKFCDNRNAFFVASICIASPDGMPLIEVEGKCNGFITTKKRGENGFGYDPIFEVASTGLTFGQIESSLKKEISHRGIAFKKLEKRISQLF